MTRWAQQSLTGWGRVHTAQTLAARPERTRHIGAALQDASDQTVICYAAGRSYGDAALNDAQRTILTSRLNRYLSFDAETGLLVAEPGVTIADIIDTFLPRGFMAPVAPGTGFASLGGCVANDVHGKNHHRSGSFGDHIAWIDLRLPGGQIRRVSLDQDERIFRATLGGAGLTGVIEKVALHLSRVSSNAVRVTKRRIKNLDEFLTALEDANENHEYVVGWIDALARGASMGRGVLEAANPVSENVQFRLSQKPSPPFDFPGFALNSFSIKMFNHFYYNLAPARPREEIAPYQKFLFPLDAISNWNRIYGKRGFRQFQCVLPFESGREGLQTILEKTGGAGRGSFLAVLKSLGREGAGYLSFPRPGYTLALDFPNTPDAAEFVASLDRIALDFGGRVYLAKDSTLTPDLFQKMYPKIGELREVLTEIDPDQKFDSDLQRRLGVRSGR